MDNSSETYQEPVRKDFLPSQEELAEVGKHVERVMNEYEHGEGKPIEKHEVIKQSLQQMVVEDMPNTEQSSNVSTPDVTESRLPVYMVGDQSSDEVKATVMSLLETTLKNGLLRGLRASRKYSPFVQDAFHDALIDKLLPELERRGFLK